MDNTQQKKRLELLQRGIAAVRITLSQLEQDLAKILAENIPSDYSNMRDIIAHYDALGMNITLAQLRYFQQYRDNHEFAKEFNELLMKGEIFEVGGRLYATVNKRIS